MLKKLVSAYVAFAFLHVASHGDESERIQPRWWFGGAAAANLNFYGGTTQVLNSALTAPAPFHEGFGTGLYLAPLVEYHHNAKWGGMLQVGYDGRGGAFDDQICPCGEIETLSAKVSYLSIEPSLRYSPFSGGFHLFAGPRVAFNWAPNLPGSSTSDEKSFVYTREGQPVTKAGFSDIRAAVFSGQIGMGYDVPLSAASNATQVGLSPFISFQPYIGEGPRSVESWRLTTWRVGVALKFGKGKPVPQHAPAPAALPCIEPERDVQFSVQAPKAVVARRRIRETFPLRTQVFFDKGSAAIPDRYVTLTKKEAADFKEEQLQEGRPRTAGRRSLRQMDVYYNILNIMGDRLKRNSGTTIVLSGASELGPKHGKARAEAVKEYLVNTFGIETARIQTEGRAKPKLPSQQPGGTKDLDLLQAEDRRVDIESDSPELLNLVGGNAGGSMKPVQIIALVEDPFGSPVIFEAAGAKEAFTSWSLEITDDQGASHQFGPFTRDRETLPGNTLLGDRSKGEFKALLVGKTKDGKTRKKAGSFSLSRKVEPVKETVRFSILFDFDKSKTMAAYEKFLGNVVTPLIPDSATVAIRGYTDVVGETGHNDTLSQARVQDTRDIIERTLANGHQRGVAFETEAFGEDPQHAPFENGLPEERFYNRTVIIDIIPE